MHAELVVTAAEDGASLGGVLRRRGYSRRLVTRLKNAVNGMTRGGQLIRTIDRVYAGERIILCCEDSRLLVPSAELSAAVLFGDGETVVYDKPPAMPVHPSMKHRTDTLGNLFAAEYPQLTFRPVNRLDRDTSGCVLAAKSQYAAARLRGSFDKSYLAVCCGVPTTDAVEAPIAREEGSLIKRCVRGDGKYALTRIETVCSAGGYTLCRVTPETGRTHQIRVHFAYIGCPLAGDELYGGSREHIGRQALHCESLGFVSPADGVYRRVTAPLPDDMRALIEGLRARSADSVSL